MVKKKPELNVNVRELKKVFVMKVALFFEFTEVGFQLRCRGYVSRIYFRSESCGGGLRALLEVDPEKWRNDST